MIRICPECGTKNALPTEGDPKRMGKPVCARCKTPLFAESISSKKSMRARDISSEDIAAQQETQADGNVYKGGETVSSKNEFPLAKNLIYGSLIGLLCSAVLLFILNNFLFPDYVYMRDEMKQTFEGGALTLIAVYFVVVGFLKPEEIVKMGFGFGVLLLFTLAVAGYLIPLFVLGALALVFSITTVTADFYNFIFEIIGPFCLGGTSVGFVAGAYHYNNPINQS
jgi:hypothetical protein